LARDERLARFSLSIERIELLLQTLVRGFTRIDGAGDAGHPSRLRSRCSCFSRGARRAIKLSHDRRGAMRSDVTCPSAAIIGASSSAAVRLVKTCRATSTPTLLAICSIRLEAKKPRSRPMCTGDLARDDR